MLEMRFSLPLSEFELEADLSLPLEGTTAIAGASGAGKTTLLNVLAGLLKPKEGRLAFNEEILFDSKRRVFIPPQKRRFGVVFQENRLFPHYRVDKNLRYGMKKEAKEDFEAVVELLGLGALLKRTPANLSGGEKQRAAIGRCLLSKPRLLLMDEPLSSLDESKRKELLQYLKKLALEVKIPILYATHQKDEAAALAQSALLVERGKIRYFKEIKDLLEAEFFEKKARLESEK